MYTMYIYIYVLLKMVKTIGSHHSYCHAIVQESFENCTSSSSNNKEQFLELNNVCINSSFFNGTHIKCKDDDICRKVFHISQFYQQLFHGTMTRAMLEMMQQCCGNCVRCKVERNLIDISQLDSISMKTTDIVFPVVRLSSTVRAFGFYFLPMFEIPSSYYITIPKSNREILKQLITSCASTWPLVLIGLLMALIAGFFMWLMEKRRNTDEFSPSFYQGVFEGFWWSFVSMTTVGYGDKTPKSPSARLFAVLWIITGIVLFSILTASLTTEIISARSQSQPGLAGKSVGTIKYRLHDSQVVSQHGGILKQTKNSKTMRGIIELTEMLERGDIEGYLINRNTFYFYNGRIQQEKKYKKHRETVAKLNLMKTEIILRGEKLMSGLLMKNETDFYYFKKYTENNHLQLASCNSLRMNVRDASLGDVSVDIFSPKSGLFQAFLGCLLGIIGFIFLIGTVYEIQKYLATRRSYQNNHEKEGALELKETFG